VVLDEDTKKDFPKKPFDPTIAFWSDEISRIWRKYHSEEEGSD
jgi:hypothetical protein